MNKLLVTLVAGLFAATAFAVDMKKEMAPAAPAAAPAAAAEAPKADAPMKKKHHMKKHEKAEAAAEMPAAK